MSKDTFACKRVKARKPYTCCLTHKTIEIGEEYKRVNIKNVGVYHFKVTCSNNAIENYINEYAFDYCEQEDILDQVYAGEY